MTFLAIRDYKNRSDDHSKYLALRVDSDNGVNVVPDMDINITKLNKSGDVRFNHFFNNGYGGITFKIRVIIYKEDKWNNTDVIKQLHDWYKNMTPLDVVTEAIDVEDGQYIISKNPSRQQNKQTYTEWELEFTTYTPLALFKYKNDNTAVLNAINKAKTAQKKKASSSKKTLNTKLSKCNYKTLVYSKKKKIVTCVKYLQQVLKKQKVYKGKIDGWFGKDTKAAVKQFQKNYNKKNVKTKTIKGAGSGIVRVTAGKLITNTKNNENIDLPTGIKLSNATGKGSTIVKPTGINKVLPTDGKVDEATFKALCWA